MKTQNKDVSLKAAKWIWCDAVGLGRNVFVLFRNSFSIKGEVRQAQLHLFADARYRLKINGALVTYGPARFVTQFPEYDTVDIQPYLQSGKNVITVEVNSFGMDTFETMPDSTGAFIAWGQIEHEGAPVSLVTPGQWKIRRIDAWDALSPRFSFGLSAAEILDLRRTDPAWFMPEFDDTGWDAPVLRNEDSHGQLQPRSVPLLSDKEIFPIRLDKLAALARDEMILSCRIFQKWEGLHQPPGGKTSRFCYGVWIYSKIDQEVVIGLFWGPHYLNGSELLCENDPLCGNRQNARARFKAGWNLLYGEPEILAESWGILIGLPIAAGLEARAEPSLDCREALRHTGPLLPEQLASIRSRAPVTMEELNAFPVVWRCVARETLCPFPARESAWDRISKVLQPEPNKTWSVDFSAASAYTAVYDFGAEYLGHAFLELEAPAGTIVDIACDERKRADGLLGLYMTNPFVETVDRFITREGLQRIEGFHVRGGRYLQVTLRRAQGGSGKAVVRCVGVRSALMPLELTGEFACSDPVLNWAWQVGRKTFEVCVTDLYIPDCWRERGMAIADNWVQFLIHHTLCTDRSMPAHCLRLFARGLHENGRLNSYMPSLPMLGSDFTLLWIVWMRDYWATSGDVDLIRELWTVVERIWSGSGWHVSVSELWDAERVFVDWGAINESRSGQENAALNAFRIRALECSAELASAIGKKHQADQFRADVVRLKKIYQNRLWLSGAGRFSPATQNGKPIEVMSLHPNVLALVFDLGTPEQTARILDFLCAELPHNLKRGFASTAERSGQLELYFLHYALEALYKHGRVALAEQLIRDHWGYMMQQGAWTTWEMLFKTSTTRCHVWSSHPTACLMHRALGVSLPEPGNNDVVCIAPQTDAVTWAQGRFPHPKGDIAVAWEICGSRLYMDVQAPREATIRIAPQGKLAELELKMEKCPRNG